MKRAEFFEATRFTALAVTLTLAIVFGLSGYWVFLFTGAVITSIALLGVGLVANRAGLISLCQMSFAAIGAWVVAWLNLQQAPGTLIAWCIIGGFAAVPFGIAIGLPALRLRGINLAIVTLGFAAAFDVVLLSYTFPGQTKFVFVQRPEFLASDQAYFAFCVAVFVVISLVLDAVAKRPLGASWLSIRHSERSTAAHGISVPQSKLSAFAISAFIAGLSGGLLAGQLGTLVAESFTLLVSMVYYVVATMAGAHLAEGALLGGILVIFFPELLRRVGLPQDIGNIFFAMGATQALSMGGTMSEDFRKLMRKLSVKAPTTKQFVHDISPVVIQPPLLDERAPAVLSIKNLTVKYGAVVALQDVSFVVPEKSVVGLIGPNGAGKSTLIDAVTGFLATYVGSVMLQDRELKGLPAHLCARAGLRRSWQQTRIAPQLDVGTYLDLAAGRSLSTEQKSSVLVWIGCPPPKTVVASVDAGTRRLLDIAGTLVAYPKIVLLDEPAAGLSHEESLVLAARIAEIPSRFGAAVLLVEHDMELVRMVCNSIVVLDFGRIIALGETRATLNDPAVIKAYVGEPEDLLPS